MATVKALVLTGFGLNCDLETSYALEKAGAQVERVHLNGLVEGERNLADFQIFVVGGGFAWGDDHGAGVIMGMRLKHRMGEKLLDFIEKGGILVGICNGFQVLVNVGVLPAFEPKVFKRQTALIGNDCGNFRNQWVNLVADPVSPCVLTRGIGSIELPVRHGEGKFFAEPDVVRKLSEQGQVILRYATPDGKPANGAFPYNPNGSLDDIAGICDPTGRVVGLMPHPEAYNHFSNHPEWTLRRERCRREGVALPEEGDGIALFRNAVRYFA